MKCSEIKTRETQFIWKLAVSSLWRGIITGTDTCSESRSLVQRNIPLLFRPFRLTTIESLHHRYFTKTMVLEPPRTPSQTLPGVIYNWSRIKILCNCSLIRHSYIRSTSRMSTQISTCLRSISRKRINAWESSTSSRLSFINRERTHY